ncbi:MAG: hypothetical protein N4A37_11575 [Prolixibacteraceae bacterium]|jgi:wobble nucleotide-excising tRNase|nr:hypothetical protein [Prolixibacteraceae bacterium]
MGKITVLDINQDAEDIVKDILLVAKEKYPNLDSDEEVIGKMFSDIKKKMGNQFSSKNVLTNSLCLKIEKEVVRPKEYEPTDFPKVLALMKFLGIRLG